MTSDLKDHKVLVRRRRTHLGWVEIVEEVIEEKADKPEPVDDWDRRWPPGWGPRPLGDNTTAWWRNGWPQRSSPDRDPVVWLQVELGTRVVGELLRLAMPAPLKEAA